MGVLIVDRNLCTNSCQGFLESENKVTVMLIKSLDMKYVFSGEPLCHSQSSTGDTDPWCIALLKWFVLVTDVKGHRLLKYTTIGQYVGEIGSLGHGRTEFNWPYFVAVNSRDVIMVSDSNNNCIKCFDSDFNYLYQYGEWGDGDSQLWCPRSIAVDGADNVYVCDGGNHRISIWSRDRTCISHLFKHKVSSPWYIAVSRDRICASADVSFDLGW